MQNINKENFYLKPKIWYLNLVFDWSIIVVASYFFFETNLFLLKILLVFVIGSRQHALTVLGHESVHKVMHKNQIINDYSAKLFCFWPLGISFDGYRKFHYKHHINLKTRNDPEIMFLKKFSYFNLPTTKFKIYSNFAKDCLGFGFFDAQYIIKTFGCFGAKDKIHSVLFFIILLSLISIILDWKYSLLWIVSLFTTQFAITRFRSWTEHTGVDGTHYFKPGILSSFFIYPHNIGYHEEHHLNARIPFYNLKKVRDEYNRKDEKTFFDIIDIIVNSSENKYN